MHTFCLRPLMYGLAFLFLPLFTQAQLPTPAGISERLWKQAQKRWELMRVHTQVKTEDGLVYEGQLYTISSDSIYFWPWQELYQPGYEELIFGVSIRAIDSIWIQRDRSFWRGALRAGLIVGGPVGTVILIEADGDLLPPIVEAVITGLVFGGPAGLAWGLIYRSGKIDEAHELEVKGLLPEGLVKKTYRYAIFPEATRAPQLEDGRSHRADSTHIVHLSRGVVHSPLMKKVFPQRRFHLSGWYGGGFRASNFQMAAAYDSAGFTPARESRSFWTAGGELMVNIHPHWRVGGSFQVATGNEVTGTPKVASKIDAYASFRERDMYIFGFLGEYVFQSMNRYRVHTLEFSLAAGPSIHQARFRHVLGYQSQYEPSRDVLEGYTRERLLPGVFLQSRLRVFPHKFVSLGGNIRLHLVQPITLKGVVCQKPDSPPVLSIPDLTLHQSSFAALISMGLHF